MGTAENRSTSALGFLTVVEHPQHGLFGGYLLLNLAGRPLEFHCTAPIKPNRAQQILYGPTLDAFLYGEQIGQTLLEHAKTEPMAVFTDRTPALAVREHATLPVALVLGGSADIAADNADNTVANVAADQSGKILRLDAAHGSGPKLTEFRLGVNRLAVPERLQADGQLIGQRLAEIAESFDLSEPFQRIRDAIEEAQQAVR
jgi:hypothetical protein